MSLQEFADRFGVTHPAVIKWEKSRETTSSMSWAIEKDMRLELLAHFDASSDQIASLYRRLVAVASDERSEPLEIRAA